MKYNQTNLRKVLSDINVSSCPQQINLHCHTLCSDGSLEPLQLFNQACEIGIKHLAITDHHSIEAFYIIQEWLIDNKHLPSLPFFWSGIEISSLLKGCLVHILGIGFDPNSYFLKPYIKGDAAKGSDLQATQVIQSISKAGGLSILAHPARYRLHYKDLILEAKKLGIDGIEVWYDYDMLARWSPSEFLCESISKLTSSQDLLSTCGTDSHGLSLLGR